MANEIFNSGTRPSVRTAQAGRETGSFRSGIHGIDGASVLGLVGAFALIGLAIALGGRWTAFIDVPAILIVLCGTASVTIISFDLRDVALAHKIVVKSLTCETRKPTEAANHMLELANRARRDGLLALQTAAKRFRREPFLARGLELAADGLPDAEITRVMRPELDALAERHRQGASMLYRAADVAPAMGLIGTLVGLVQMLGNLEDPAAIGPGMAVALLTTFYGAILANMVFAPLAGKLERKSAAEALVGELYLIGITSIARQENPRRLEMLLNTVLPPNKRVAFYR